MIKKLLKLLASLFSGSKNSTSAETVSPSRKTVIPKLEKIPEIKEIPKSEGLMSENLNDLEDYYNDIDFLISRLKYVGNDLKTQLEKRLDAMERLQKIGPEAEKAIPTLIRSLFAVNEKEKETARKTLENINANWFNQEAAHQEFPFLIQKLNKEQFVVSNAIRILRQMGKPATAHLMESLQSDAANDPYFLANLLMTLSKLQPDVEKLLPILDSIPLNVESGILLKAYAIVIHDLKVSSEEISKKLIALVAHKDPEICEKGIKALGAIEQYDPEMTMPVVFSCLSNDHKEVRMAAIEFLASHQSDHADAFYLKIIQNRGKLSHDDYKQAFEKVLFWVSESSVEEFRSNKRRGWSNISWYNLELQKELTKPELLLESILQILNKQQAGGKELTQPLQDVFHNFNNITIQKNCMDILGNIKEDRETLIPFFINQLRNPSDIVRSAVVNALQEMDEKWINRPDTAIFINKLIADLDHPSNRISQDALLSIGTSAIPLLSTHLEQTNKRVLQDTIVDILGKFGSYSEISLPTLLKVKEKCSNTHTLQAINDLINKLKEDKEE